MEFFKPRGIANPKEKPQTTELEMVSEEVDEGTVKDMAYHEDPTEANAREIVRLEDAVEDAKFARDNGQGNERQVRVQEVLLAKARYDQALQNERAGRGKRGEVDRLVAEWQKVQDRLEALHTDEIARVRERITTHSRGDINADTAAQLRRHA